MILSTIVYWLLIESDTSTTHVYVNYTYFCVASQNRIGRAYEEMKRTLATNGSRGAEIMVDKMQLPKTNMKSEGNQVKEEVARKQYKFPVRSLQQGVQSS